jgi:hypothetical protein
MKSEAKAIGLAIVYGAMMGIAVGLVLVQVMFGVCV